MTLHRRSTCSKSWTA